MSKAILVTGATGKQGGSVVDALLASPKSSEYLILAVTRDAHGGSAQKLVEKGTNIRVVGGNLDNVPALFEEAKKVAERAIWGVYSVQVSMGKGVTFDDEVNQGKDLIDEAVKHGVGQFVYSSVERGGDEHSWDNETPVGHFKSKHLIEHHLKQKAGAMNWTILRPVAFMDNLAPGMQTRVFMAALRDTLKGRPCQWIAASDIGWFAADAFDKPEQYNHKAIGLAGDELTFDQMQDKLDKSTSAPPTPTFSIFGSALTYFVPEFGTMLAWFHQEGYKADIAALRKTNPNLLDLETWVKEKSLFPKV